MKNIRLYDNHTQYESDELEYPNVSYCINEDEVHYNPTDPDPYKGHEYVEIGGLKWATMNIGAESPTDWGQYFAYGETIGYDNVDTKQYSWSDYKFTEDGGQTFTKYNTADGLTTLQPEDDAAHIIWGGNWRTPTLAEFENFIDSVNITFTSGYNGTSIPGIICTDKQDSSKQIFFPQAGVFEDGRIIRNSGSYRYGVYNSSTLSTNYQPYGDDSVPACSGVKVLFWTEPTGQPISIFAGDGSFRKTGHPIRAVAN